jgi:DnaK suppressor protein
MTASFQVSRRVGHAGSSHLTAEGLQRLRAILVRERDVQSGRLAEHESTVARLSQGAADDDPGVERDLAVLHAARAREAIQEIDHALARVEDSTYGTCEACGSPIPFERLEAVPQARSCVACPRLAGSLR